MSWYIIDTLNFVTLHYYYNLIRTLVIGKADRAVSLPADLVAQVHLSPQGVRVFRPVLVAPGVRESL